MESSIDNDDPYHWSAERVIQEVCQTSLPAWANETSLKPVQRPEDVKQAFIGNDIDGQSLLDLDHHTLKDDLHLGSFGQRRTLLRIIDRLRSISLIWQSENPNSSIHVKAESVYSTPRLLHTPQPFLNLMQNVNNNFHTTPGDRQSVELGYQSHVQGNARRESPSVKKATSSGQAMDNAQHRFVHDNQDQSISKQNAHSDLLDTVESSIEDSLQTPLSSRSLLMETKQPAAQFVVVGDKQKRRRIAPTLVSEHSDPAGTQFGAPSNVVTQDASSNIALDKSSKRKQTNIDRAQSVVNQRISAVECRARNPSVLDLRLKEFQVNMLSTDKVWDRADIDHTSAATGLDRSRITARLMKRLLRADYQIVRDTSDIVIVFPQIRVRKNQDIEYILIRTGLPPEIMRAKDINMLDDLMMKNEDRVRKDSLPPSLRVLLQKYATVGDEELYPVYGESDEEDRIMTDEETTPEPDPHSRLPSHLGRDAVDDAIDSAIEEMKLVWKNKKLPKIQARAYRMWMKAARDRHFRTDTLQRSERLTEHAKRRLPILRDGIHQTEWTKVSDIKQQSLSLESTIHDIEEHANYIEVLTSQLQPSRPTSTALKQSLTSKQIVVDGDISCESENEDEDLSLFVDDSASHQTVEQGLDTSSPGQEWNPIMVGTDTPDVLHDEVPATPSKNPVETPYTPARSNVRSLVNGTYSDPNMETATEADEQNHITESALRNVLVVPDMTDASDSDTGPSRRRIPEARASRAVGPESVIDLTLLASPTDSNPEHEVNFEVRTPELNPIKTEFSGSQSKSKGKQRAIDYTPLNEMTEVSGVGLPDVAETINIDWEQIKENDPRDHRRALAKSVYGLTLQEARSLLNFTAPLIPSEELKEVVQDGIMVLAPDGEEEVIAHIPQHNQEIARHLTCMFICYACADEVSQDDITQAQVDEAFLLGADGTDEFGNYLCRLLRYWIGTVTETQRGDSAENHSSQDRDSGIASNHEIDVFEHVQRIHTPQKKRKHQVLQSKSATRQQQDDQNRVAEQEIRKRKMAEKLSALIINQGDHKVPVTFTEPLIYLDTHIARRVKPHQIEGIQFMWRELIEDPKRQGCLLAHTMGLGKTMQVISVLVTIAQCLQSPDPALKEQIPTQFQELKVMVLCPPTLIENWYDELLMWMPKHDTLGSIVKTTTVSRSKRDAVIATWAKTKGNGVLLIGYDKFRSCFRRCKDSTEEQMTEMRKLLLETPNIVVADEAHTLKNVTSQVAQLAKEIFTTSRVALTGSPLNNHLNEYHQMVNWIAPGYLGSLIQFKAKYSEPIERGMYQDSTVGERRVARQRLHRLKQTLAPKIHRADVSAIAKDMPSKVEFFITVPLTELQKKAYQIAVHHFRQSNIMSFGRANNAHLWSWLSILSLLCNHPACFVNKLEEPQANATNSPASESVIRRPDDEGTPEDIDITAEPSVVEVMTRACEVFEEHKVFHRMNDPELSYRAVVVQQIVKEANAVGDRILVFSHSIPTLNFLEGMLKDMGCDLMRIDGSTDIDRRQEMTKCFNTQEKCVTFLISTRAGGLGLNLHGANRVIIYDFGFNPMWEQQAIGRAYRLGQQKPVFVYRFKSGGTYEDVVYNQAIVFKTQLFSTVVDEKNVVRQASKKTAGAYLFDPQDPPQREFTDVVGKDVEVLDRVLQRVDCVREILLTETFFEEDEENLTAEEIKEIEMEMQMEKLEQENPKEYAKVMASKAPRQATTINGRRTNSSTMPKSSQITQYPPRHYLELARQENVALVRLEPQIPLRPNEEQSQDDPTDYATKAYYDVPHQTYRARSEAPLPPPSLDGASDPRPTGSPSGCKTQ